MNLDHTMSPPNIRHMAAQQLTALVSEMLEKHFKNYGTLDAAYGRMHRFYRDLEDKLSADGYCLLNDFSRERVGMAPIGPEGWTRTELYAYEAARLTALLQPTAIMVVEIGVEEADMRGNGHIVHNKAPGQS